MKKGKFVIISGPSGVGKDTICDELVKKGVGRYSVSMTTRKKRSNEIEGISYFFVSKEEFERHIEENYFLEYAMYNGNYYGTPNEFIKETTTNGDNVIAILEIKGAINAKKIFSDAITIFIMPPSFDDLKEREFYYNRLVVETRNNDIIDKPVFNQMYDKYLKAELDDPYALELMVQSYLEFYDYYNEAKKRADLTGEPIKSDYANWEEFVDKRMQEDGYNFGNVGKGR